MAESLSSFVGSLPSSPFAKMSFKQQTNPVIPSNLFSPTSSKPKTSSVTVSRLADASTQTDHSVESVDSSTQTIGKKTFATVKLDITREQAILMCIMTRIKTWLIGARDIDNSTLERLFRKPHKVPITSRDHIGLYALVQFDVNELSEKYGRIAVLHTSLIHALLTKSVKSREEMRNLLKSQCNKQEWYTFLLASNTFNNYDSITDDYWMESFSVAVYVTDNTKQAKEAIQVLLDIESSPHRDLAISFACDLLAASGCYVPSDWLIGTEYLDWIVRR